MLKLSASSMGTYESCPKKYHYSYIEKPEIVKKDWIHLEFGLCAHRTLELFHQDLMKNVRKPEEYAELMKGCFRKALSELDSKKIKMLKPELGYLTEVLQDYLEMIRDKGLTEVIATEQDFKFELAGFSVKGVIDRIDRLSPTEYMIVDYKTNKNPAYLKDFQLVLYALYVKDLYPEVETIHGRYILLKHKSTYKDWTFTEKDFKRVKKKITDIGQSITIDDKWEKKPTMLCNWCDYKSICQDSWI